MFISCLHLTKKKKVKQETVERQTYFDEVPFFWFFCWTPCSGLWNSFYSCCICYTFGCLGQDDYQLPLPLLLFRRLNLASIRGQRTRWCWPAQPHRDNRGISSCCTDDMTIRYPLQCMSFCPSIVPHSHADFGVCLPRVLFFLLLLPLRWTPSCRLALTRFCSLWAFCQPTQPSLNSSAVCTRAKRVATVPSVHICSWSGRKVHISCIGGQ